MMNNNKILTVSYGTFSCTLEGFEDSFGTMKAIAEYFRDLAADDRYFGAEPPQPDAEMLARIAQKEISRRVEATHRDGKIVLSALEDGRTAAAAPAALAAAPTARMPEAPAADVAEVQQPAVAEPAPAAAAAAAPMVEAEDTSAEVAAEAPAPVEVTAEAPAPAAEETPDVVPGQPDADVEAFFADSTPAMAEDEDQDTAEATPVAAPAALPDNSIAAKLQRIRAVVAQQDAGGYDDEAEAPRAASQQDDAVAEARTDIEDALDADDAADMWRDDLGEEEVDAPEEDDIDAILQRLEAGEEEAADATPSDTPYTMQDQAGGDDSAETLGESQQTVARARVIKVKRADLEAAVDSGELEADEGDAEVEGPVRRASSLSAEQEDELARELAALEADMGVGEETTDEEAFDEDALDRELAELEAAAHDIAADMPQEEFTAAETAEDDDPAAALADDADEEDDRAAALSDDEEEAVTAAMAEDEAEADDLAAMLAEEQVAEDDDAAATTEAQDAEEDALAAALAEAPVAEDDTDATAEDDDRISSLVAEDESDVAEEVATEGADSIFAEDDLAAEDASDAPAAQRAARATLPSLDDDADTSVSRLMAESDQQMHDAEAATRRDAFSHLRAAVAAKKAEDAMGEPRDEARGDDVYRNDLADVVRPRRPVASGLRSERPAEGRPAPLKLVAEQRIDIDRSRPAGPVRPRRVAAVQEVASSVEGESFAEFAAEMGATRLPQLLEAAAAYMSFVEGREQFSRPQLMSKVRQASPDNGFSREDGLRSFGQLLRAGKIEKIKGGRFTVSEDIGFRPDHRAAG